MTALPVLRDHIAESLAGNPAAIRMQMGQHEEIVTDLRTQITLLQKLNYRERAWIFAVTAWLISEREQLVVTIDGAPNFVHSLFETDKYGRILAAILAVVEDGIPSLNLIRYLCPYCKDIRCGGGQQCAGAADPDHVLRVRMPKEVRHAAERVVEVRQAWEAMHA
jgi:hypothetical protein